MSKFQVTYANGETAEFASECESVEGFCNEHFGSAWDAAQAAGAKVVMEGAVETKEYADGTVATGVAPLPDESPAADTKATKKRK